MKTLYERLKPEVKQQLELSRVNYETSINIIYDALKNNTWYSDLTLDQVSSIHTFSGIEIIKVSVWDFKYGDNILITEQNEC